MSSENQKKIVAKNLEKLLKRKGKNQTDMARDLNIPEMTVSNWLRGVTYPRVDKVQLMADYFGVYRSDITDDKPKQEVILEATNYPYLPHPVAAGLPENVDGITGDQIEKISIPDSIMGKWAGTDNIFIMRTNGQSMNKVIPDQSLIAVKPTDVKNLKDNDIVVFSNDNEYSVKRFYNDKENKRFIFSPESNDKRFIGYPVPYDQAGNLKIHGKVVVYIVELD